jgi:inosine-uridine nucleoside N-ribohydrolase
MADATKVPVILDTDIGGDIDDTWALAMLLRSPELDLRLVTTDTADTEYRARIAARMLDVAGRTDVPVGIGVRQPSDGPRERQAAWVADYTIDDYPGTVHADGVAALIDTIMTTEGVTLICIGPMPNIKLALEREPRIARRARFVGMQGSVRRGYGATGDPAAEYNVRADVPAAQAVFTAPWDITITPLDTCGRVVLRGDKYRRVRESKQPLCLALMENYRTWLGDRDNADELFEERSSVIFDTVAVHLAHTSRFLDMEDVGIRVNDDGFTIEDPGSKPVHAAMDWEDLEAFEDELVERLTSS